MCFCICVIVSGPTPQVSVISDSLGRISGRIRKIVSTVGSDPVHNPDPRYRSVLSVG